MHQLSGTTWRSHVLTIHVLSVDENQSDAELEVATEPASGNRTSLDLFWFWVDATHAEQVDESVEELCVH
ncbi:MAG TPA: hypothetical protein VFG20_16900 [Planctomycetaceae bacterium]|jgi:hypothetical protein|nr:hypothetical protein [Planctomycetaceae bacterium]